MVNQEIELIYYKVQQQKMCVYMHLYMHMYGYIHRYKLEGEDGGSKNANFFIVLIQGGSEESRT